MSNWSGGEGGSRRRRPPAARVQSLGRALDLLEALAGAGAVGMPLKALAGATGLNPSTAHHLLSSLLTRGYVDQHPATGFYLLGGAPLGLAHRFFAGLDLADLAGPLLRRLHGAFDEWVVLSALRGTREYNLVSLQSTRPLVLNLAIDPTAGLNCTAVGKVLLSSLDDASLDALLAATTWPRYTARTITDPGRLRAELGAVRGAGYATNREEHFEGLRAVAAPVRDATGRTAAAVGLAYPTVRADPEREAAITAAVRQTATALSERLGYRPAVPGAAAGAAAAETGGKV